MVTEPRTSTSSINDAMNHELNITRRLTQDFFLKCILSLISSMMSPLGKSHHSFQEVNVVWHESCLIKMVHFNIMAVGNPTVFQ